MKYRFLIYDEFDGAHKGTNDEKLARNYAEVDEYHVVDAERGVTILPPGYDEAESPVEGLGHNEVTEL